MINGAFIPDTLKSLCIGAVQPIVTLLLVSTFIAGPGYPTLYSAALGSVVLMITIVFLLKFKTFKTEGAGISSLLTFQSFLKSWVSHKPAELEGYFKTYSRDEQVTTRVVLATGKDRTALVLPGVHPGPFFPVGSYNISELIFHAVLKDGVTPMVLHGVGGHERNLPTNDLAKKYSVMIADAVKTVSSAQQTDRIRGPSRSQTGPTTMTTIGIGDHIIAFLSNAPFNTDDLEPSIIDEAVSASSRAGVELMLVDAHNSIGGENCQQPKLDWTGIFSDIRAKPEQPFEIGVARSSELQFEHGSDISDGGVAALVIRNKDSTFALVTSDSNNAIVGLRQAVAEELKRENIELIELCTSDTHSSAARALTTRGYAALGEDTDRAALVTIIGKLVKLAEGRLSPGSIATVTSQVDLPLIGDKSLNDFAALTKDALDFARTYAAGALASLLVICSLALL